jgi:hypothetical protein
VAKSGEHRMLFDLRGRRKRVIQVAYAGLALIMALSLFTVVGPVNLGDLFGNGSSGSSSSAFDDAALKIERKLARDPKNEKLLVQDTRARYTAANAQIQFDPNTGQPTGLTQGAVDDYNKSADAWLRYIKLSPKQPDPNVAQLAATSLLYSAATSTAIDFSTKIKGAAQAQQIYAQAKPSLNSYLTLARYRYLSGDFAGGDEAGRKAEQAASKQQRASVQQVVGQYRKQGKQIDKQIKAATKFHKGGGGKQALENPLGGLSGGGSSLGATPP